MILVFVGAGGSAAVDPKQYPTTVGFFERLPDEIKGDYLFGVVHSFLKSQKKEGQPIDVEEVLWNLDKVQKYFSLSCNPNTIEGWVMANDRLRYLIRNVPDLSPLLDGMPDLAESQIPNLKDRISTQVYQLYAIPPDADKLSDWVQLLEGIKNHDPTIEIFTTNYDRVLERVIHGAKIDVETGLKPTSDQMVLDTTFWDYPGHPLDNNRGRLTKLHGSVNWQNSNEGIIVGNPIFTENHQNHVILYPGFKGKPDKEPFIKFHEHLRAVAGRARAAIFIGFAFRDDYINEILSSLPSRIPKYVINKDDSLPDLHFLEGCGHFNNGLTEQAVEDCIKYLEKNDMSGLAKRNPTR